MALRGWPAKSAQRQDLAIPLLQNPSAVDLFQPGEAHLASECRHKFRLDKPGATGCADMDHEHDHRAIFGNLAHRGELTLVDLRHTVPLQQPACFSSGGDTDSHTGRIYSHGVAVRWQTAQFAADSLADI